MGDKPVLFNIDEEIKREFLIILARNNLTIKDVMTGMVIDYNKIHKEGNEQHLMTSFLLNDDFVGFPSMGIDFKNKKAYTEKNLQSDNRLNELGKELWAHILQWQGVLQKY